MDQHNPQEERVRSLARRRGYQISKSRLRLSIDNHGEFMLADDRNHCCLGARYDASLDDIEAYLREGDK